MLVILKDSNEFFYFMPLIFFKHKTILLDFSYGKYILFYTQSNKNYADKEDEM